VAITVVFSFGSFESILEAPGVARVSVPMDAEVDPTMNAQRPEMRIRTRSLGQRIGIGSVPRAIGFGVLIASGRGGRGKLPGVATGKGTRHVVCRRGCSDWRRFRASHPPTCQQHGEEFRLCPGCRKCRRRLFGLL
jgi:hypothetical protein